MLPQFQLDVDYAENDAPEQHGGTRTEEAGREVPSAQDGALPYRPIPEVDEEFGHGRVRVVPVQDADEEAPVQELRQMEAATEDDVDRDTEKDRKREEPVRNQGTICGRAVHWSDLGLLENDKGGGEGGAAGAATRTNEGGGGGRYTVSLATLSFPFLLPFSLSYVNPRESSSLLLLFLSFSPTSFLLLFSWDSRAGAGGVAASRWRTARGRSGRRTGKGLYIISS